MEKLYKLLMILLSIGFSIVTFSCSGPQKIQSTPTAQQAPDIKKQMYFKSGRMIECDTVWEGYEGQILCKQSEHIKAYSAGDVDLTRTFGESTGKEIAKRYEAEMKKKELLSQPTIVTPEQERYWSRTEKKQSQGVNKELIDLENKFLNNKLKSYKEKQWKASGPPPKGRMGFNEKEFYEEKIKDTEKKIEMLQRNPELYFYEKSAQSAERSKRVKHDSKKVKHDTDGRVKLPNTGKFDSTGTFYAPSGDGGFMNTKTGEFLAPTGDGGAFGTKDGTYYAPSGDGSLINTKTGEFIN